jgi:hypothetical protein
MLLEDGLHVSQDADGFAWVKIDMRESVWQGKLPEILEGR